MTERDISGRIAQLFIHPIKSCAGIEVSEALLTPTGLKYDRHWMLVNNAGHFLTQREFPKMALIKPSLTDTHLIIDAPGMSAFQVPLDETGDLLTVQVWKSAVTAFDMGEVANAWFSQVMGMSVKLVRFNADEPRACSTKWTGDVQATTEFADGYPLLVTTRSAIDELNQKLVDRDFAAVDQRRFRPNIVLDGLPAHDEDLLEIIYIEADEPVQIKNVKPCSRCPIPSIDPDTAVYQPEAVGDTIQSYRQDARVNGEVTFGMNAIVLQGAGQMLRVGQVISADYAF